MFDKTYLVAYSGGLDSQVLLSLCHTLRTESPINIRAIHIHHGLSPNANKWATHCRQYCEQHNIEYIEHAIKIDLTAGDSLEAVARQKRYQIFAEHLSEGDVLLTAHHQDDQAETVLLQLLRGAGPKGLSAMPEIKPFAKGWHMRPLLSFTRDELHQYAKEHQLEWVEDESNQLDTYHRNFIRLEILPALKKRWPSAVSTIARSAKHCSEAQALLEECISEDWKNTVGSKENTLSVQKLLMLSSVKQRYVLRAWIQASGFLLPDTKKMAAIQCDVLPAKNDRHPLVSWEGAELRRHRDDLYVMSPLSLVDTSKSYLWDIHSPLELPGIGVLQALPGKDAKANTMVTVAFRQGGEKLKIAGKTRTLKNLFQEWDVLPWMRDRLPLLFVGDRLVGVVGYFLDEEFVGYE